MDFNRVAHGVFFCIHDFRSGLCESPWAFDLNLAQPGTSPRGLFLELAGQLGGASGGEEAVAELLEFRLDAPGLARDLLVIGMV